MKLTPKQIHHLARHIVLTQGAEPALSKLILQDPVLASFVPKSSNKPEDADAFESLLATLQDVLLD